MKNENAKSKKITKEFKYNTIRINRLQKREKQNTFKFEKLQKKYYALQETYKREQKINSNIKREIKFAKKYEKVQDIISEEKLLESNKYETNKFIKTHRIFKIKVVFMSLFSIKYRNKILKFHKVIGMSNEFKLDDGQKLRKEILYIHKLEALDNAIVIITIGKNHLNLSSNHIPAVRKLLGTKNLIFYNPRWYMQKMKKSRKLKIDKRKWK